jgi:hypothetical protein
MILSFFFENASWCVFDALHLQYGGSFYANGSCLPFSGLQASGLVGVNSSDPGDRAGQRGPLCNLWLMRICLTM